MSSKLSLGPTEGSSAQSMRAGISKNRNAVFVLLLGSLLAGGAGAVSSCDTEKKDNLNKIEEVIPEYRRNIRVVPDGSIKPPEKSEKKESEPKKPTGPICWPDDNRCAVV